MSVCWVFLFSFTTADIDISWFYLEKGNVGGRRRELVTLYVFNHSMFHFQFNFCTKNTQSLDLDMAAIIAPHVTWQSPVEHGRRDFHRSKLWYQQPLWPQMMNCKSDRETTGPPQYKTFTQSHTGSFTQADVLQHMDSLVTLFSFQPKVSEFKGCSWTVKRYFWLLTVHSLWVKKHVCVKYLNYKLTISDFSQYQYILNTQPTYTSWC